jgi:hypothetical protein
MLLVIPLLVVMTPASFGQAPTEQPASAKKNAGKSDERPAAPAVPTDAAPAEQPRGRGNRPPRPRLPLPPAPEPNPKAKTVIFLDFEEVAVGGVPEGYRKQGPVEVVDDVAHTGKKSLRINPTTGRDVRRITCVGDEITGLGGSHWGRLYFKMKVPHGQMGERERVIHSTFVCGNATSPLAGDLIEMRMVDTVMRRDGLFQYIHNVQPRRTAEGTQRPEFNTLAPSDNRFTDEWTLAEWHLDYDTQTYRFFLNGKQIDEISFSQGKDQFQGAEIPPVFQTLSFGFTSYQTSLEGYTLWLDDIAVGKERIGGTPGSPQGAAAAK